MLAYVNSLKSIGFEHVAFGWFLFMQRRICEFEQKLNGDTMTNLNYLSPPRLPFFNVSYLYSLLLPFLLFPISLTSQPFLTETCQAEAYAANRHAVWLPDLANAPSALNLFDENGGLVTLFDDGTALITGTVYNSEDSSWQWTVNIRLIDKKDWSTWSSLERTYKGGAGQAADDNFMDWDYWELDEETSYLAGVPGTFWAFDTLYLRHKPSNKKYGFQKGIGANDKNEASGLSGWFDYSFSMGEAWALDGKGDVNVTLSCEEVSCELDNLQVQANCIDTETSYEVIVSFEGTQGPYLITDDQGNQLTVTGGGTYLFNTYPSEATLGISVTSTSIANCQIDTANVTAVCAAPVVCTLDSLEAVPVCTSDSTFTLEISFSGEGTNYLISDDKGSLQLAGVSSGTYTFGTYPHNELVSIAVIDPDIPACNGLLTGLTTDCTPEVVCGIQDLQVAPSCTSDSTFTLRVTLSGEGNTFTIRDDQGTAALGGLSAGTYTYGTYSQGTEVIVTVEDTDIADCTVSSSKVSGDCTPPPVCTLENLLAEAVCTGDSTFEVRVSFLGTGSNFTLSDNKGTARLTGLSAGTYTFGSYANGEEVAIAVTDSDNPACNLIAIGLTEDCTSEEVCELEITLASASCTDTAANFFINVSFSGSSRYTITDDQGIIFLSDIPAGSYLVGPYPSGAVVSVEITDEAQPTCSATTQLLTASCVPPVPVNDLCSNAIPVGCNEIIQGTTVSATDIGVCGFCGTHTEAPGVWYTIIGTGGLISLEVTANFDARLNVFEFGCDTLSCVDGNDNQGGINRSVVSFSSMEGREYFIYVNGTDAQTGSFELKTICAPVSSLQENPIVSPSQPVYVATIRPNPVRDFFQSNIYLARAAVVNWMIEDRNGRVVQSGEETLPEGIHTVETYLLAVPEGPYTISYRSEGKLVSVQKLIILK